MRFDVFLEGAIDPSTDGIDSVANAIANRYGISATDIKNKLAAGRVRIKANIDRAIADGLVKDILSLGGIATVIAAGAGVGANSSSNANSAKLGGSALSGMAARAGASNNASSGLAAAASFQSSGQDDFGALGALSLNDDAMLSASGGGHAAGVKAVSAPSFAPPGMTDFPDEELVVARTASVGAKDGTLDLFAPPDELADVEPELERELSPRAVRATAFAEQQASIAAQSALSSPASLRGQSSAPSGSSPAMVAARQSLFAPFANLRRRLAAGAVLAVLVGGVPAVLVAGARQNAEFKAIDARVALIQTESDTMEAWTSLDIMRRNQIERKRTVQRSAFTTALAMWFVIGGVAGYAWLRLMPWDRLAPPNLP
jgi:hypothetical protein